MDEEIKELFILIIQTKKHNIPIPILTILRKKLQSYGEIALKALKRYITMPNTPFFDFSAIMGLIYDEKRKELNIDDAQTAWGKLGGKLGAYQIMPKFNPVLTKTINGVGGWYYLGHSSNKVADRANFYKTYDHYLNEYITETL